MSNQTLSLNDFVDKLMIEKGVNNMPESAKKEIAADLLERLEDRINAAMLANVRPDKLNDFESVLDNESDEVVQEFLRDSKNILEANIDLLIAKELMDFRDTYITA